MSWDRKKKGNKITGYFYESVRVPGCEHPVKRYWGRGAAGQEKAAEIEARREQRRARQRAEREEQQSPDVQLALDLKQWVEALATAWLLLAGCREHRGEWRKVMNKDAKPTSTTRKPRAKAVPYSERPTFLRSQMTTLNKQAGAGDKDALKNLEALLADNPWLLDEMQSLSVHTEHAWLTQAANQDPVQGKAFAREVEALKADLSGGQSMPIKRLIVDHVVVSFLALKHAELQDRTNAATAASGMTARRVVACQKRFKAAVRWLQTVDEKSARGVEPSAKLKIFTGKA